MATKRKPATVPARYTRPTRAAYKLPPAPPPCCNELDPRFGQHGMVSWGGNPRYARCRYGCGMVTGRKVKGFIAPTLEAPRPRKKAEKSTGADLWAPLLGPMPAKA